MCRDLDEGAWRQKGESFRSGRFAWWGHDGEDTGMSAALRKRWRLYRMLRTVYHREGVWIWLRHAKKQGWTLDEQLQRAEQLTTGAFV